MVRSFGDCSQGVVVLGVVVFRRSKVEVQRKMMEVGEKLHMKPRLMTRVSWQSQSSLLRIVSLALTCQTRLDIVSLLVAQQKTSSFPLLHSTTDASRCGSQRN